MGMGARLGRLRLGCCNHGLVDGIIDIHLHHRPDLSVSLCHTQEEYAPRRRCVQTLSHAHKQEHRQASASQIRESRTQQTAAHLCFRCRVGSVRVWGEVAIAKHAICTAHVPASDCPDTDPRHPCAMWLNWVSEQQRKACCSAGLLTTVCGQNVSHAK